MIFNPEIVKRRFEPILSRKADVGKESFFVVPLCQSAIVKGLHVVFYDKGHDVVRKAFFEHDESANTAIAVLKRMDSLESYVETDHVFKGVFGSWVVRTQKSFDFLADVFGKRGLAAAYFVGD